MLKPEQYHLTVKKVPSGRGGIVVSQKRLSPYVWYENRRQVISWLFDNVTVDRFFFVHDDPLIKIIQKDGSKRELRLLTKDLIRGWIPKHIPNTGQEVVQYVDYVLKATSSEDEFTLHYHHPDLIRFEPKAGCTYEVYSDFAKFLHYEGSSKIDLASSSVSWYYQSIEQRVLAYYIASYIFVCCYDNLLTIPSSKKDSLLDLVMPNRMMEQFGDWDVRVMAGEDHLETEMTFITEAKMTAWAHAHKNLPMTRQEVVDYLIQQMHDMTDFQQNVLKFMLDPDGKKIDMLLTGSVPPRMFTFSANMVKLMQIPSQKYVITDQVDTVTINFIPNVCLVVKSGSRFLWGMNGGTLWIDPSKSASVCDLNITAIRTANSNAPAIRHTDEEGNVTDLKLLDDNSITTWLAASNDGMKVMPQTARGVSDYVALIKSSSQLLDVSAYKTGLTLKLNEAGQYELSASFARFLDYSSTRTITVYPNPNLLWHYDDYDNPSGVTMHSLEEDKVLLNVSSDHVLACHHGLQHVLGFQHMTSGSVELSMSDGGTDKLPGVEDLQDGLHYTLTLHYNDVNRHSRTVALSAPESFYSSKRALWTDLYFKHLFLWPSLHPSA